MGFLFAAIIATFVQPVYAAQSNQPRIREARTLILDQKWSEALVILKSLSVDTRLHPDVAIELSRTLTYLGRREEALKVLIEAAERQGPKDRESRALLMRRIRVLSTLFLQSKTFELYQEGQRLLAGGKLKQAQTQFEKALESEPDHIEILKALGQTLFEEGDFDSSAEKLRLARNLNPYDGDARLWLGKALLGRSEIQSAIDELKTASPLFVEKPEALAIAMADAHDHLNQPQEAMKILLRDVKDNPKHLRSLLALVQLRIKYFSAQKEMLWEARKELQLALSRFPEVYGSNEAASDDAKKLREELLRLLQVVEDQVLSR